MVIVVIIIIEKPVEKPRSLRYTRCPIRKDFAMSHLQKKFTVNVTSQNLCEWGLSTQIYLCFILIHLKIQSVMYYLEIAAARP